MKSITPIRIRNNGQNVSFNKLEFLMLNYQPGVSINLYWKLLPVLEEGEIFNGSFPEGNEQMDLSSMEGFSSLTLDQINEEIYSYLSGKLNLTLE